MKCFLYVGREAQWLSRGGSAAVSDEATAVGGSRNITCQSVLSQPEQVKPEIFLLLLV